ncbi:methyltransferase domain-containing protein [Kitasatospora purpeofusca]|uniref:protein-L-isoaspartate O-methyltransferase family protein n=1 Tax=Kitasatospora purpeofusca TaxID=67352 RepID=UPI00225A00DA|nr:methyltransferase domain-containing protein [Kitasatospora purpeofusca]MCX4688207.1 methyltransferase domain-containing protein [Kitasatospora purpeofusca]
MDLAKRRAVMDEAMTARGDWPERSPWLREAVAALPRDEFAPDRLWRWDGHAYAAVDRHADPDGWAAELYASQDAAAVTQVSGGLPSSSLSAQGVVVDMLDSLQLESGHRVWDIGGGQGWNAALAAWRAGPGRVVSTEIDPGLAAFAQERLAAAGLDVETLTADATTAAPGGGPFDRVIATYAVERVPWAWIEATGPSGRIVYPWGRLGHVALTVAAGGRHASGHVQGLAQFMADRTAPAPSAAAGPTGYRVVRGKGSAETERSVSRDLAPLESDWDLRFALRVAVPDAVVLTGRDEDGVSAWVHDGVAAWAMFSADAAGESVLFQGGGRRIGDEVLQAWKQWEGHGRPDPYEYGITVTPEKQFAWLADPDDGPRWPRHEAAAATSH